MPKPKGSARGGFTLVEMLVAVGLVVLMMSLFATIFQFATSAMAIQKGVAENDQKVRLVMTLLRGDLKNRTMAEVLPFRPADLFPTDSAWDPSYRLGYLYLGENDPDDATDDILQFTVDLGTGDDLFYGRAAGFTPAGVPIDLTGNGIAVDPNQPEYDDGYVIPNGAGSSPRAEIAYFLRRGTLYRRVLLIRQPTVPAGVTDGTPMAGSDGLSGGPISLANYENNGIYNFRTDFDYSAYYDPSTGFPVFHGQESLSNTTGGQIYRLGKPNFRFGFYAGMINSADPLGGLPREFTTNSIDSTGTAQAIPRFFGRFTHEETSYYVPGSSPIVSFGYPGRVAAPQSPNPYSVAMTTLTLDDRNGQITANAGQSITYSGSRIAEDILMTNVHQFDVKVWDDAASFGPDGQPGVGFLPGPDGILGTGDDIPVDDDQDGTPNNVTEIGWPGSDDGAFRDVGHTGFFQTPGTPPDLAFYSRNSANFNNSQSVPYCPVNPIKAASALDPAPKLYRFDTWNPNVNLANPSAGAPYDAPPFRAPDAVNVSTSASTPRPLRALQIKIRFFDQTSQQLRDVTFVQSLTGKN